MNFSPRESWEGEDRKKILGLIYRYTHADYKGMSGERWGNEKKGYPAILVNHKGATALMLVDDLSTEQINSHLAYVSYRHEKEQKQKAELARNKALRQASMEVVRLLVPSLRRLSLKARATFDYERDVYVHTPTIATFEVEGKPATSLTAFKMGEIRGDHVMEQQALALVTHHRGECGDPVLIDRLANLLEGIRALAAAQQRTAQSYEFA